MRTRELLIAWLLATTFGLGSCDTRAKELRPNIVVIVVDTLRADHTDPELAKARTPAIDGLAKDGVRFERAFSHAPATLPSHTSLFSSRPPSESSVRTNGQPVPKDLPLLAEWVAKHGYSTHAVVSLASMWPASDRRGLDRGFGRYDRGRSSVTRGDDVAHMLDATLEQITAEQPFFLFAHFSDPHEPYDAHGAVERYASISFDDRSLGSVCVSEATETRRELLIPPGKHSFVVETDRDAQLRSLEFTAQNVDLSWEFVEGSLHDPHRKFVVHVTNPAPARVASTLTFWLHDAVRPDEAPLRYRSEVEFADRCVGDLLGGLKRRGLYDSSIIVFTSDHGEALGEHATWGHIVTLYDELLHVPLVFKLPSTLAGREVLAAGSKRLVRLVDVAPTLLDLVDLPPLPDQRGTSLLVEQAERVLFAQTQRADGTGELFCARDEQFKLIYSPLEERFELYDVVKDPLELGDVYATRGKERWEWTDALRALAARTRRDGERQIDPEARARLDALGY